ncbi:MAG TPA: thioredoxin [Firmicutes bacterium]|nr:thioredoxin [Bacillota bacterium]
MSVIYCTDGDFKEVTDSGVVLVDFYADWCGPCKMIAPLLDELAVEYDGKAKIVKVNVDECPVTAASYKIMSIPTLLLIKDGTVVEQVVGFQPKPALKGLLDGNL